MSALDGANILVDPPTPSALGRAVSVPYPPDFSEGDAPSSFDPLLSFSEQGLSLQRSTSNPTHGDYSAFTLEMFITALEMNGTAHELGWFPPGSSIGEIKRQTSEKMCVPFEAIRMASASSIDSGSTLTDDMSPLGEVWPRFGPGGNLGVVVQIPESFEETLKRVDDIRVHEDAYNELVKFACQFEHKCVTPANASVLLRVVQLICDSLETAGRLRPAGGTSDLGFARVGGEVISAHKLSRAWAIKALSKLLEHSMKQFLTCNHTTGDGSSQAECSEKLENTMQKIVEALQQVSQSDCWLEKQDAAIALEQLKTLELHKVDPALYRRLTADDQKRANFFGGA